MIYCDFKLAQYNTYFGNSAAIVSNLFQNDGRNMKEILYDISIAQSTYRLAKLSNYVGNDKLLSRIFEYYDIRLLDDEVMERTNDNFNEFFTAVYYSNNEVIDKCYGVYLADKDILMHSPFIPIITIVEYLHQFTRVSMNRREMVEFLTKSVEEIGEYDAFYYNGFEVFKNYILSYYYANKGFTKEYFRLKNILMYEIHEYPIFKGFIYYNLAITSFWVNNMLNAVEYAKEAIMLYNQDNCLERMNKMKLNLILFYIIGHSPFEARQMINAVECHNQYAKNPIIDELISTHKCYSLIEEQKYEEAVTAIKAFLTKYKNNEMRIYLAFCYYMLGDTREFKALYEAVSEEHNNNTLYEGYYRAIILLWAMFNKESKKSLLSYYSEYKQASTYVSNAYYYRLIDDEFTNS